MRESRVQELQRNMARDASLHSQADGMVKTVAAFRIGSQPAGTSA